VTSTEPQVPDEEILTPAEACAALKIHMSLFYQLVRRGKLPAFRIGSDWRVRRESLRQWLEERSTSLQAPNGKP
jgi:excisionase family DNA binding protein